MLKGRSFFREEARSPQQARKMKGMSNTREKVGGGV